MKILNVLLLLSTLLLAAHYKTYVLYSDIMIIPICLLLNRNCQHLIYSE